MTIASELTQFGDEAEFRDRFVIPLLYRLGFAMVVNYHGTREFGRDIIFGEFDRFNHPVYYGLQAKYLPSIGQSESHGLAEDAKETFAHPFDHPQRHIQDRICRFYAVNAGSISENARTNFFGLLEKSQAANAILLDGAAVVALDRHTSFTRGALVRELILGLSFEIKTNRATGLLAGLKTFLSNGAYPMTRLRTAATLAMLERPVIAEPQFMGDLQEYWHVARTINQIVDSLDLPFVVTGWKETRGQVATELIARLDLLGAGLEKRLLTVAAEFGKVPV
jgi:hypothetical protein